ncbi:MAG: type II toxin-antitoxin system Phd/YefM family antitoxin [Hyphomicrobiales bacterium]|nr:MAG: type II toxin-antitoxin system Phd/YefM family antitoxin [Hyphomicrobiales bacterium]
MTRKSRTHTPKPRRKLPANYWRLQDAKARFSELVRRAKEDGPQHVTLHGREEAVILSTAEFQKLKGTLTGAALVDLFRSSPLREVEFGASSVRAPVRDVKL